MSEWISVDDEPINNSYDWVCGDKAIGWNGYALRLNGTGIIGVVLVVTSQLTGCHSLSHHNNHPLAPKLKAYYNIRNTLTRAQLSETQISFSQLDFNK